MEYGDVHCVHCHLVIVGVAIVVVASALLPFSSYCRTPGYKACTAPGTANKCNLSQATVGSIFKMEQGLGSSVEDEADGNPSTPHHGEVSQIAVLRLLVVLPTTVQIGARGSDRAFLARASRHKTNRANRCTLYETVPNWAPQKLTSHCPCPASSPRSSKPEGPGRRSNSPGQPRNTPGRYDPKTPHEMTTLKVFG